jgi:hypothetical protein
LGVLTNKTRWGGEAVPPAAGEVEGNLGAAKTTQQGQTLIDFPTLLIVFRGGRLFLKGAKSDSEARKL